MARTRLHSELISDVRLRSDMVNSTFVTDPEITGYLNEGIAALHRMLVQAFGDEYFEKEASPTTSIGVATVALPADFLRVTGLWWEIGTDQPYRLEKYTPADARIAFVTTGWALGSPVKYRVQAGNFRFVPTPQGVHQLRLHYIPPAVRLSAPGDVFEGYDGFEDYPIWHAVMKCKGKQESDVSLAVTQMQLLEKDILESADRDDAEPARVQRKRAPGRPLPWPWPRA